MKKNKLYLIIAGVLAIASIATVLVKNNVFTSPANRFPDPYAFAIKDTSLINKIFIADMRGNRVLLTKTMDGWIVDDSIPALAPNVDRLLSVLRNLIITQTVPKAAQKTINKMLSINAMKVEIYETAPKFKLFGICFFVKERKTKTYYIGDATQVNMGNYAIIEGMSEPYVITIPGFMGFVTPYFSPYPKNWYSHILFNTKITRIQSVDFVDFENPEESFRIVKSGIRFFDLYDSHNQKINDYDTTKILDMLSEFRERNYESIANLTPNEKDSLLTYNLFKIITLTDVDENNYELKCYRLMEWVQPIENDEAVGEIFWASNQDRFYGVQDNDFSTIYRLQYYHFDRQVQPLSYFLKKR